jgi:hypothetical protein
MIAITTLAKTGGPLPATVYSVSSWITPVSIPSSPLVRCKPADRC